MGWTKKHFIAVADILKSVTDTNIRQGLAQKFSALFIQMNPRFSVDKFNDYVMEDVMEDDSMTETYRRKIKITTEDISRIANRIVEMGGCFSHSDDEDDERERFYKEKLNLSDEDYYERSYDDDDDDEWDEDELDEGEY